MTVEDNNHMRPVHNNEKESNIRSIGITGEQIVFYDMTNERAWIQIDADLYQFRP
jgi:hypothetical protein